MSNAGEPIDVRAAIHAHIEANKRSKPHAVVPLERCMAALDELFAALTAFRMEATDANRIRLAVAHARASGINVEESKPNA